MMGLFEATRLQPDIRRFEIELAELTGQMKDTSALGANQELLDKLSALAAALEADAAASTFRFGASRAYDQIVRARLETLREEPAPGGAVDGVLPRPPSCSGDAHLPGDRGTAGHAVAQAGPGDDPVADTR